MQRLINQRAKLFWVISIMEGDCHVYAKNLIKFAINRKSDPVSRFEAEFFPDLFLVP